MKLTEQQRAWLDTRNGYDLIHAVTRFEQIFNVPEEDACCLILQWINGDTISN